MASKSRLFPGRSQTFTITDAGVVIDWPKDAGGNNFESIELSFAGGDVFCRSGDDTLLGADVVRESDNAAAHDRKFYNGDIIPDLARFRDEGGQIVDSKIAFRTEAAVVCKCTINPGV